MIFYNSAKFFLVFCLFLSGASFANAQDSIQIKGSDTMVNLGQAWAEVFMTNNPQAFVAVTGGGSGTGIAALLNKTCDIAQCSRSMEPKEYQLAKNKGCDVKEIAVANDAIAFVVHPDNPVDGLSISQLSDIFTGKIRNWKEIGGKDEKILPLSRDRNSGTHVFVLEEVVRKGNQKGPEEFAPSVLMMPSSQAIEQEVSSNLAAIGYFGLGYVNNKVKTLKIMNEKKGELIEASIETVHDKTYPLARPLLFYLPREAEGSVKQFIDFVLSPDGQKIVLDMHFVPLTSKKPANA